MNERTALFLLSWLIIIALIAVVLSGIHWHQLLHPTVQTERQTSMQIHHRTIILTHPSVVELCTIRQENGRYAVTGYDADGWRVHSRHGFTRAELLTIVWELSKRKRNKIRVFGDVTFNDLNSPDFVPPAIQIE